jgi:flagellar hook-basal body complex protein FliE
MADINNISGLSSAELLAKKNSQNNATNDSGKDFASLLKAGVDDVNKLQKTSEKAMSDIATGQVKDLHQAAIAIDKAEMSMKLMLEVRNKAVSAYKEILRTQM